MNGNSKTNHLGTNELIGIFGLHIESRTTLSSFREEALMSGPYESIPVFVVKFHKVKLDAGCQS